MTDNKLTIVHVVDSGGMYGKERVIYNLVKEQQNDFNIIVINIGTSDQVLIRISDITNVICAAMPTKRGFNFGDASRLRRAIEARKPDIIHVHDIKSSIYVAPHLSRSGPRIIRTLHGYTATKMFSRAFLQQVVDKICLSFHHKIIGVSNRQQGLLSQVDSVIWNGIPIQFPPNETLDDDILQFCDKEGEDIRILCAIGRLSDEKNHKMLISAINKCKRRGKIKLLIIGHGRLFADLWLHIVRLGIEKEVYLAGFHPNAAEYLSTMDVEGCIIDGLVQPSKIEGTPITVLEAFRAKVPVLVSPVGDMTQLIASKLVSEADITSIDTLAASVDEFCDQLDNDGKREQVLAAHRAFVESYSSEVMARKYADIYTELAGSL